jgi:progressive ankylosis protein
MQSSSEQHYWRFYWPLALTGLISLFAQQLQNAALARYPDATKELATFAIAAGVFHLFDAALVFVPQMVNVLARTVPSARVCLRFTLVTCGLMTLPVIVFAFPPIGKPVLGMLFHVQDDVLNSVILYMGLLAPNILIGGLRSYYTGLLIQSKKTATVTVLNVAYLVFILIMLVTGSLAGWQAVITLAIAQLTAAVVSLILLRIAAHRYSYRTLPVSGTQVRWKEVFDFFWPVALTSIMFSLSRPILYSFLSRLDNPAPVIAAMRVGFDFAMIFHNLLNQFRHLFVTYGSENLAGVRRFMIRVTIVVVSVMVLVTLTPLSSFVLQDLIGIKQEIFGITRQVLLVLCFLPVIVTVRNYFHGIALSRRQTGPMGAGAVGRNVATYLFAAALFHMGWLNHMSAAMTLIMGFVAETMVVIAGPRIIRQFARREEPVVVEEEVEVEKK